MSELEDAVRRWAQGVYPMEAGAELLIRDGKAIYEGAPWLRESGAGRGQRMVAIDTSRLSEWAAAWSGSERRVVAVALSLMGGHTVNLYDAVTGLDPDQLELVLAAVSHAAGSHEARMPVIDGNRLTGYYTEPVNAHPWPERLNTIGTRPRSSRAEAHEPGDSAAGVGRSL